MNDLAKKAEAMGLYVEVHESRKAVVPMEMYCGACELKLMDIAVGESLFLQTHGRCTCSWSCCEKTRPGNQPHVKHLEYRATR